MSDWENGPTSLWAEKKLVTAVISHQLPLAALSCFTNNISARRMKNGFFTALCYFDLKNRSNNRSDSALGLHSLLGLMVSLEWFWFILNDLHKTSPWKLARSLPVVVNSYVVPQRNIFLLRHKRTCSRVHGTIDKHKRKVKVKCLINN